MLYPPCCLASGDAFTFSKEDVSGLHREELPLEVLRLMVSIEQLIKSPAAREARAS